MTLVKTIGAAGSAPRTSTPAQSDSGSPGAFVSEQPTNLFLLDDIEDANRTWMLAESDLTALRAAADWITSFVAKPHKHLGRPGPVCPYVPFACERKTLWLAPERIASLSVLDVVELISGYKKVFLDAQPVDGDDANYKSLVVAFTDLPADRAKALFDDVLQHLEVPSYVEDGLVLGGFYESNEASAIYNPGFRPFTPPVPFLLMRHAVISDWKFFLENDWLNLWARFYGESAVQALAEELRRLPWRARRD